MSPLLPIVFVLLAAIGAGVFLILWLLDSSDTRRRRSLAIPTIGSDVQALPLAKVNVNVNVPTAWRRR